MSKSRNKLELIGHVGSAPELRATSGGMSITTFSVATNRRPKEGEKEGKPDWHRCKAFGKPAELLEKHLKKGDRIFIDGEIQYDSYQHRTATNPDGTPVTMYTHEVIVNDFNFLGGPKP